VNIEDTAVAYGAFVTTVSMAVATIRCAVSTADGVAHCGQRLDTLEPRVQKIGEDVGYLRGRCEPARATLDEADKTAKNEE
jgi:hypothetical protein